MFRKLTLFLSLTVCAFTFSNSSSANIITYSGGPVVDYALGANDTLFIASGTYTGSVSGLNANNRTIIVAGGATFNPLTLAPTNGVVCKMFIYGTFTYTSPLTTNTSFTLDTYAGGIVNLATLNTKGKDQVWTNNIGGTINFSGDVLVNGGTLADDNNVFINRETINASGNFQMNSGSNFTNYKYFNVAGTFKANGGVIDNKGKMVVTGLIDLNSGASSITNWCRMETSGGISVSNGFFYNYSYLWAKNSDVTLSSGGTIQNMLLYGVNVPIIHGRGYTQSGGTMNGPARLWFYGTTKISGGVMGVGSVVTPDTIKFYDRTRTVGTQIMDIMTGTYTIYPNVIFNYWGDPDSNATYLFGCSEEIALLVPLAINWRSFDVVMSTDNLSLLLWSADFDKQTVFDIERSYDGRNFSMIEKVDAIEGKKDYRYSDKFVNNQASVAYYRIKAVELNGEIKYSSTKMIRFSRPVADVQTSPNPFINNFNINYQSGETGYVTIRIFNVNGQQKLMKTISVIKGNNNIDIVEAANFTRGIYIVQLSNSSTIIASNKIIKQ